MTFQQATDVADDLVATLKDLGRLKVTDLAADSQYGKSFAFKRVFKKGKTKFVDGGDECQFNLRIDTNNSFRATPLGYVVESDIPNVLATGKMPWRHSHYNWSVERRLISMNRGTNKVVDLVDEARRAGLGSMIKGVERWLWRCPTTTLFDDEPVGIPYFVVKSATAFTSGTSGNYGFTGTVPSGYTLVANINPTSGCNGRWKNYAEPYTQITTDDLVTKMRRCAYYTDFEPLTDASNDYETGDDFTINTNYAVSGEMVNILDGRNENLGADVATNNGKATFMRTPIEPIRYLDNDTTNPVYMLNWGCMNVQALRGEWNNEQVYDKNPNQPTMTLTVNDSTWNLICYNRQRQGVISNGVTVIEGA